MSTSLTPATNAAAPISASAAAPVPTSVAPLPASTHTGTAAAKPVLTDEQKQALKKLHAVAQQFESLFVNMLFKSMREASPQTSITGDKQSNAESTFTEMLDEKRSEAISQTGAFGIAKVLEDQLRASVLANPAQAAKARSAADGIL
jgi:Rod binding domain-containing protein